MELAAPSVGRTCSSFEVEDMEVTLRCLCADDDREPVEEIDNFVFASLLSGRGLLIIAVLATLVL